MSSEPDNEPIADVSNSTPEPLPPPIDAFNEIRLPEPIDVFEEGYVPPSLGQDFLDGLWKKGRE